jgi:phosphoglycolate phosphatase-like HAD superfamily hydrolase
MLDAVAFDFDGVILESVAIKTEVFRALFADYPDHVEAIVALHERLGGISRHVKFQMIHDEILGIALTEDRRRVLAERFEDLALQRVLACPMVPGALDTLTALSARLPLAVVSGTPQAELQDIVRRRDLAGFFVKVLGSPRGKADHLRDLFARHGWRPQAVVMVGDAITDYDAAREVGCRFIGRVVPGQASPFPPGTYEVGDLVGFDPRGAAAPAPLGG